MKAATRNKHSDWMVKQEPETYSWEDFVNDGSTDDERQHRRHQNHHPVDPEQILVIDRTNMDVFYPVHRQPANRSGIASGSNASSP